MLWVIYDEDNNKTIKGRFVATLDEAILLLIEAGRKHDEDTEFYEFGFFNSRRWGIRLYPNNRKALLELETNESRDFLCYGEDVLI